MATWGTRLEKVRNERGAAAVETALCICFLVVPLVLATISYAYMLSFRQSLSQAAAEGARAAAVAPAGTSVTSAETVARNAIDKAFGGLADGLTCSTATVPTELDCDFEWKTCGTDPSGKTLSCLTVEVSYPYRNHSLLPTVPGLGFTLPSNLSYSATAQVG